MQKLLLRICGGLLAVGGGAAVAADSTGPLVNYYENTWALCRPTESILIFANADGTWDGVFSGVFYAGKDWHAKGELVCFNVHPSAKEPNPDPACFKGLETHKVGDRWDANMEGQKKVWQAGLVKGRTIATACNTVKPASKDQSAPPPKH